MAHDAEVDSPAATSALRSQPSLRGPGAKPPFLRSASTAGRDHAPDLRRAVLMGRSQRSAVGLGVGLPEINEVLD